MGASPDGSGSGCGSGSGSGSGSGDGVDANDDGIPDHWTVLACGETTTGSRAVRRQGQRTFTHVDEMNAALADCDAVASQGAWEMTEFACAWWNCTNATHCDPWMEQYFTPGACSCEVVDGNGDLVVDTVICRQAGTQNGMVGCGSCNAGSGSGSGSGG